MGSGNVYRYIFVKEMENKFFPFSCKHECWDDVLHWAWAKSTRIGTEQAPPKKERNGRPLSPSPFPKKKRRRRQKPQKWKRKFLIPPKSVSRNFFHSSFSLRPDLNPGVGAPCAGQRRAADAPLDSEAKLRRSLRLDSLGAARPIGSGYMVTFSSFVKDSRF